MAPPPVLRQLLGFGYRMLWAGIAIAVVPALAWWLYNRIDEAPTAQARHWFAALPQPARDRDSAWL